VRGDDITGRRRSRPHRNLWPTWLVWDRHGVGNVVLYPVIREVSTTTRPGHLRRISMTAATEMALRIAPTTREATDLASSPQHG
jgi:hypothetical protein